MTRQVNAANQVWFEKSDAGIKVGFTKDFLDTLTECWHILPASRSRIKEKAPLITIETNDALVSILSPVSGSFVNFSYKAQNFPDQLKEDDVVLELREGPVQRRQAAPELAQVGGFVRPRQAVGNDEFARARMVIEQERNRLRAQAEIRGNANRLWTNAPAQAAAPQVQVLHDEEEPF